MTGRPSLLHLAAGPRGKGRGNEEENKKREGMVVVGCASGPWPSGQSGRSVLAPRPVKISGKGGKGGERGGEKEKKGGEEEERVNDGPQ